jgi:hypothetical protein
MRVLLAPRHHHRDEVVAAVAEVMAMDHRARGRLLDSIEGVPLSPEHHAALHRVLAPPLRARWGGGELPTLRR